MGSSREHPKLIGDRSTAKVLTRFVEIYGCVFLPFGENQRYDLVVDDGERLLRVQVKTGRLNNGVVRFPTCSNTYHHPNAAPKHRSHHYRGQADIFAVYCPETDEVYALPVDDVGLRSGSLRIDRPLNSQSKNIRWAEEFVLRNHQVTWATTPAEELQTLFESAPRYSLS